MDGPAGVTGWTTVGTYANSTLTTVVYEKALAAGDVGSSATFTSTSYDHASANLAVYSGVSASSPIGSFAESLDTATPTHKTPTITATAGEWVLSVWADRSTATRTYSLPATVKSRDVAPDSGTLTMQSAIADSNGSVSAGSYGGLTATTDSKTDRSVNWTIALNPA